MKWSKVLNMQNFLVLRGYTMKAISLMTMTEFIDTYNKEIRNFR